MNTLNAEDLTRLKNVVNELNSIINNELRNPNSKLAKNSHIEDLLMQYGIGPQLKGFRYIIDSLEFMKIAEQPISFSRTLYPFVAKKNNVTSSSVERAMRVAIKNAEEINNNSFILDFKNCNRVTVSEFLSILNVKYN